MADSEQFEFIINFVDQNSQKDSAMDDGDEYQKRVEARRKKLLQDEKKSREEVEKQLLEEKDAIEKDKEKKRAKDRRARLEEEIKYGATLEEREYAKRAKRYLDLADQVAKSTTETFNNLFYSIKNSGKQYADYVERLEVGLIGSTKSYESVSNKLDKVFSMNVFFSLNEALNKTTEMVERGISYNVELRSALDVMSDKIASTFDALDSTLTRLVKIQQADSTQARLGMESLLTYYLNENFQNTEYLHGLSDQVSAAILEAMSTYSGGDRVSSAAEFEYSVQKWLGSFSSAGVSDSTIMALAQGLGYLGSGDVSSLASNSALQQLIAIAVSKSGSERSYGDMLLNGINSSDVSNVLTGFYNLVKEVSDTDNLVALNQYAKIFNLSISDITSVLNLNSQQINQIAKDMKSYTNMMDQVESELSTKKLFKRSSYSEMVDNVKSNIMASIGLDMADNLAANLVYEALDQAATIVDQLNLGIEVEPFGVGASTKIEAGNLIRNTAAISTFGVEFAKNIAALGSALSPNLGLLGGEENSVIKLLGGSGTSGIRSGVTKNQAVAMTNTSDSAVYDTIRQSSNEVNSSVITADIDEEKERMEKVVGGISGMGDSLEFIIQLLNVSGVKVRSVPGGSNNDDSIASFNKASGFYSNGGY